MKITIPEGKKAILLDLGGVLLDLKMQNTFDAFAQLGCTDFYQHFDSYMGTAFIEDFEEAKISEAAFIETLKQYCAPTTTHVQVVKAWNAMLGTLPKHKLAQLQIWKTQYQIFLYSNSNTIHAQHFFNEINQTFGINTFQNCFNKMYFSFDLKIRKPKTEGYLHIMEEQHLQPHEIFYIEDGKMHAATAQSLGIETLVWQMNESFI